MRRAVLVLLAAILALGLAGGAVAANPGSAGGSLWIVQFDTEHAVNQAAKDAIIEHAGGATETHLDALGLTIVRLPNQAAAAGLLGEKGVLLVEADSYKYYDTDPLPWGVDRIDSEEVWLAGNTGEISLGDGVNVAVLDSGADTDHPDLAGNIAGVYSTVNRDTGNVEDKNGHGTHTAGTIAAVHNTIGVTGVAPDVDLYIVQISRGSRIRMIDILEGINWSVGTRDVGNPAPDIQVMSMSFGGGYSEAEDIALRAAYDSGIVLVASAGNSSGGSVGYPAALSQVIAVSAVDKNDQIASFSSLGTAVELAAPGVSILSTYKDGGYATMSGTSMAAPHVAGVAALVIASGVSGPDAVRLRLQTTAQDLGDSGKDNLYGYGLVDAENAVLRSTDGDDLPPPPAGTITGTVTDEASLAIDGATVTVDTGQSATTNSLGAYTIAGVPVGTHTVTASAPGYGNSSVTGVDVADGETTSGVNLALSAIEDGTSLTVTAITYATEGGRNGDRHLAITVALEDDLGNPVAGASVSLTLDNPDANLSLPGTGTTGSGGTVTFTLKNAPFGTYTTTITGATADGLTWDGITPDNGFTK